MTLIPKYHPITAGGTVDHHVKMLLHTMKKDNVHEADFEFNDLTIRVYSDSNPNDIVEKYMLKHSLRSL